MGSRVPPESSVATCTPRSTPMPSNAAEEQPSGRPPSQDRRGSLKAILNRPTTNTRRKYSTQEKLGLRRQPSVEQLAATSRRRAGQGPAGRKRSAVLPVEGTDTGADVPDGKPTRRLSRTSLQQLGHGYARPVERKSRLWLPQADCIPSKDVFEVMETLSSTLIFKNATPAERVLLAGRLRYLALEDSTYLIREGEETEEPAIFMIASGKATISLNKRLIDGSAPEVDIRDIKYPDYFGEGLVLTDSKAYANVRAKENLVVYYIVKSDIDELISPKTRALMVRDMKIRKFQKEHLDDLFEVIRGDPSGMLCLAKFAREQHMDGNLLLFNDVMAFKRLPRDLDRRKHVRRIFEAYIQPPGGGTPLVYTQEGQRRKISDTIDRIEGRVQAKGGPGGGGCGGGGGCNSSSSSSSSSGGGMSPGAVGPQEQVAAGRFSDAGERDFPLMSESDSGSGRTTPTSARSSRGASGAEAGGGAGAGPGPGLGPGGGLGAGAPSPAQLLEAVSEEEVRGGAPRNLSTLFDDVLEQNVIPTIQQDVIPVFIQSRYFEDYMRILFPSLEASLSDPRLERLGAAGGEAAAGGAAGGAAGAGAGGGEGVTPVAAAPAGALPKVATPQVRSERSSASAAIAGGAQGLGDGGGERGVRRTRSFRAQGSTDSLTGGDAAPGGPGTQPSSRRGSVMCKKSGPGPGLEPGSGPSSVAPSDGEPLHIDMAYGRSSKLLGIITRRTEVAGQVHWKEARRRSSTSACAIT